MKTLYYIASFMFLFSCCNSNKGSYNDLLDFDYDYEIRSYNSSSDNPENLRYIEYYRNDTIVRRIGREGGCTRYFYDSSGMLLETRWGRNCSYGRRNILIYDSIGRHISNFITRDSIVDIDTVDFEQIYFYDNLNRLTKELIYEWRDSLGNAYGEWKCYNYSCDKIVDEITLINSDTLWIGKYTYDKENNLIEITLQPNWRCCYDSSHLKNIKTNQNIILLLTACISHCWQRVCVGQLFCLPCAT